MGYTSNGVREAQCREYHFPLHVQLRCILIILRALLGLLTVLYVAFTNVLKPLQQRLTPRRYRDSNRGQVLHSIPLHSHIPYTTLPASHQALHGFHGRSRHRIHTRCYISVRTYLLLLEQRNQGTMRQFESLSLCWCWVLDFRGLLRYAIAHMGPEGPANELEEED